MGSGGSRLLCGDDDGREQREAEAARFFGAAAALFTGGGFGANALLFSALPQRGCTGAAWLAVESLYSMDGDPARLADLAPLADREGARLLIDEAHVTGMFDADGRGLAAYRDGREKRDVLLRPLGNTMSRMPSYCISDTDLDALYSAIAAACDL